MLAPAALGEKPDLLSRPSCDARRSSDRVAECLLLPGKLSGPKAEASELMALACDGAVLEREMAESRLHVDPICRCPLLPWKRRDARSEIQLHGFWRVSKTLDILPTWMFLTTHMDVSSRDPRQRFPLFHWFPFQPPKCVHQTQLGFAQPCPVRDLFAEAGPGVREKGGGDRNFTRGGVGVADHAGCQGRSLQKGPGFAEVCGRGLGFAEIG